MKIAAYMDAGRWYTQTFQNGDMIYFTPTAPQKNGGWKGLQVDLYVDSGRPRKAKQISVARSNFGLWKEIPERDVPKNVMAKFKVRMASEQDFWMDQADVAEVCPSCALKMAALNVRRIRASVFFGVEEPGRVVEAARNRTAAKGDKWQKMPKGWTDESRKKFWDTLTGDRKHKVTACIKKMEGKVDDPGAFCASLADRVEGKEWRSESREAMVQAAEDFMIHKTAGMEDDRIQATLSKWQKELSALLYALYPNIDRPVAQGVSRKVLGKAREEWARHVKRLDEVQRVELGG